MIIEKISPATKKAVTMDLDVTEEQIEEFNSGKGCLEDIFPNLTIGEIEFIKSGITPEECETMRQEPEY